MSVIWAIGFEGQSGQIDFGSLPPNGSIGNTAAYSNLQAYTGSWSLRCNPASGANGSLTVASAGSANYVHFGMYVATLPSVDRVVFGRSDLPGNINVRLTSAGALAIYLNTTLIGTSPTTPFSSVGWHWVGIRTVTGTSVVFLQIDGSDAVTGTATVTAQDSMIGFSGGEASAVDAYFDDIVVDDTGFLARSRVDIALPISDNTVSSTTNGAGGTTGLWDAVNNLPPAGVASASETATSNIKFPASVASSYSADLETYTTLGVASGDTVLAVRGIIRHGEDIATGTKNGTYTGLLGNPTQTDNTAFAFGNDGGAHGAEPGGLWASLFGTLVVLPTVTLSTSAQIVVTRASQTRVGCVDFMGMLVVWTPAVVASNPPHTNPYIQLLPQ